MEWRLTGAMAGLLLGVSAALADELTFFRTPSGNIHCLAYDAEAGGGTAGIDCEIRQITRRTLNVKRPADCDLEWGNRVGVREAGRAELICHGDTLATPDSRVLGYGRSFAMRGITCTSTEAGLECRNRQGRGFFLSKARQALY